MKLNGGKYPTKKKNNKNNQYPVSSNRPKPVRGANENSSLKSFPLKTYQVRSDNCHNISWFNDELKSKREKLTLLRELDKQYNAIGIKQQYKKVKSIYRNKIQQSKINFNNNLIQTSFNHIKCIWQIVKKYRGAIVNNNNKNISMPTPDDFNNYFSNIVIDITRNLPDASVLEFLDVPQNIVFDFDHVTYNEVRDIIDSLKNKNSRYIYGFNIKLVKTIKNIILIPLTNLIEGIFPQVFKMALVKPIHKKGDQ
nr:unnamed protein product [Callosobruchus analis]